MMPVGAVPVQPGMVPVGAVPVQPGMIGPPNELILNQSGRVPVEAMAMGIVVEGPMQPGPMQPGPMQSAQRVMVVQ